MITVKNNQVSFQSISVVYSSLFVIYIFPWEFHTNQNALVLSKIFKNFLQKNEKKLFETNKMNKDKTLEIVE